MFTPPPLPSSPGPLPLTADPSPVETFTSALEKLAAASGVDRRTPAWQHGSIARRVEFLNRVAVDGQHGRRFQRRVDLASGLVLATVLSPALYLFLL